LWSASRGVDAVRLALNVAHGVRETRPYWKTQAIAIAMTVLGALLLISSVAVIALGGRAGAWLAHELHFESAWTAAWPVLRWPVAAALILVTLAVVYHFLPDGKRPWRLLTPGSTLAAVSWLLGTWGFTKYTEYFPNYGAAYGSIGGVILLLTWLYLSGLVFILGGEIDSILRSPVAEARAAGTSAPTAAGTKRPSGSYGARPATQYSEDHADQRQH
jgi:membrane protein